MQTELHSQSLFYALDLMTSYSSLSCEIQLAYSLELFKGHGHVKNIVSKPLTCVPENALANELWIRIAYEMDRISLKNLQSSCHYFHSSFKKDNMLTGRISIATLELKIKEKQESLESDYSIKHFYFYAKQFYKYFQCIQKSRKICSQAQQSIIAADIIDSLKTSDQPILKVCLSQILNIKQKNSGRILAKEKKILQASDSSLDQHFQVFRKVYNRYEKKPYKWFEHMESVELM